MTHQEAEDKALKIKWKTDVCHEGECCWCRLIVPTEEIKDDNGHDIYIAGSGMLSKSVAEHIVKLHNNSIE